LLKSSLEGAVLAKACFDGIKHMQDFELPFLPAETRIENAFGPMIEQGVSGVVVAAGDGFRLLHFTQLRVALGSGLQTLGEVVGAVDLPECVANPATMEMQAAGSSNSSERSIVFAPGSEYCLLHADSPLQTASVCSRHEAGAGIYLATSPGYSCDAVFKHYYPPNKRGTTNHCVVFQCHGHIP
jgi:hypothetical protein